MKKNISFIIIVLLLNSSIVSAQWLLGGNNTGADERFGTNTNFAVIFETFNQDRGRLTNTGLWGIGNGLIPNARLHVNSLAGETPFRVQVNGASKLVVGSNGGVSVGSLSTAPSNGLFVSGNTGIGTSNPSVKFHVNGGTDATLTTGGYILAGLTSSTNVVIDDDEIMARKDSGTATLSLNNNGGLVHTGGDLDVGGADVSFGSVETLSDAGANTIGSNSDFIPTTTDSRSLGSSTNRWASVWFTNGVITSDLRLKKDIKDLDYGLKEIMQLRPVKFTYKQSVDQSTRLGFIAQELQKVLPETVVDYDIKVNEATGKAEKVQSEYLGISYQSLFPVLINSIQQQQKMIEAQNKKIEELTDKVRELSNKSSTASGSYNDRRILNSGLLEQNSPNPFSQSTTIRYNIPAAFNSAALIITSLSGKTLKEIRIAAPGSGTLTIDAGSFASGTYTYALKVDGKILDSKKMVLTNK